MSDVERWDPAEVDAVAQLQGYQDDLLARVEALERITDRYDLRIGAVEGLSAELVATTVELQAYQGEVLPRRANFTKGTRTMEERLKAVEDLAAVLSEATDVLLSVAESMRLGGDDD